MRQKNAGEGNARWQSLTNQHPSAAAFEQAVALHQTGRLAEAENCYQEILKAYPDHFDSLQLLGIIYGQRGNYAEAALQFDAALKINPDAPSALSNRGLALEKLERL